MKHLFFLKIFLFGIAVIFVREVYSECTEEENLYQCEGGQKCIPIDWLCDRAHDCPKGDDENHIKCGNKKDRGECEAFHFECIDPHSKKKKCIRFEWKCDGSIDCENGIDEVNCEPPPTIPLPSIFEKSTSKSPSFPKNISKITECKADEFQCIKSNECINRDKVCDDKKDCNDGSDESEEKCSMPPIKPLIQPNSKQISLIETEGNLKDKTTTPTTIFFPIKISPSQNLPLNQEKIIEKSKSFSTVLTTLKFTTPSTSDQQPLVPINGEKVSNSMINTFSQQSFTTLSPLTYIFSKSVYSNFSSSSTTTTTKTPITFKSMETTNLLMEKINPVTIKTFASNSPHSIFSIPTFNQNKKPLQIPPIIPAKSAEKEASHKKATTEKPQFLITYKMSAEAIKEKPQHFSVISQSNVVSSSIKKMEPIHPKIGVPIIPVNHFQLLIPLSALKKEDTLQAAKTTTKNVKHFKNGEQNATTTVSPVL